MTTADPPAELRQHVLDAIHTTPQLPAASRALRPIEIRCSAAQTLGMFWRCRTCWTNGNISWATTCGWSANVANAITAGLLHLAVQHPTDGDARP